MALAHELTQTEHSTSALQSHARRTTVGQRKTGGSVTEFMEIGAKRCLFGAKKLGNACSFFPNTFSMNFFEDSFYARILVFLCAKIYFSAFPFTPLTRNCDKWPRMHCSRPQVGLGPQETGKKLRFREFLVSELASLSLSSCVWSAAARSSPISGKRDRKSSKGCPLPALHKPSDSVCCTAGGKAVMGLPAGHPQSKSQPAPLHTESFPARAGPHR